MRGQNSGYSIDPLIKVETAIPQVDTWMRSGSAQVIGRKACVHVVGLLGGTVPWGWEKLVMELPF